MAERVASPWEIAVGAVLVQHTQWARVVEAIRRLEEAAALSPNAIDSLSESRLAELVRVAGTPSVKALRLKNLARWLIERHGGSMATMLRGVEAPAVAAVRRRDLLSVNGVGPETADAILLYAGSAPLFVVDAYTRRVMRRHGWGDADASYDGVQSAWAGSLPRDAALYNEAHALLVRVGRQHCVAPRPRCEGCPLAPLLPADGPLI